MRPMTRKILNGVRFCTRCGSRMLLQGYDAQHRLAHTMKQETICYTCAFWQDIRDYPPDHIEVLGDKCLKICPIANKNDKSLILGGKGKMRYFIKADLSIFQSNDIWFIGIIPQRFRYDFEPTVKEITSKTFKRLQKNGMKCKARGCFDRYHCLRYDLSLEKDGAFNSIPLKWNAGDERCKFFINLDSAYIDDGSVNNNSNS